MVHADADNESEGAMVDANNDLLGVMEEFCLLSPGVVKPSYATILKQGGKSAPPTRGYAAAVAALSGIPATTKAPAKWRIVHPKK